MITPLVSAGKSHEAFNSYEDKTSTFILDGGLGAIIIERRKPKNTLLYVFFLKYKYVPNYFRTTVSF